jgi:hypothetical protein
MGMELQELLNLRDVNADEIEQRFDEIANLLLNEYHVKKGHSIYEFLEIEFYYYTENHEDIITYPRNVGNGKWFFHNSGVDISFESQCLNEKLSAKIRKPDNDYFGGILIRSVLKDGNKFITGPLKCMWFLFDYLDAFGNIEELPIIVKRENKKTAPVLKTNRYIPINEEKSQIRFGNNYAVFAEYNKKQYRYYIKHLKWDEIKKSEYSARPW